MFQIILFVIVLGISIVAALVVIGVIAAFVAVNSWADFLTGQDPQKTTWWNR